MVYVPEGPKGSDEDDDDDDDDDDEWLVCQKSDIYGSVLGLLGLVSVYWNWVGYQVSRATSISFGGHFQFSLQILP